MFKHSSNLSKKLLDVTIQTAILSLKQYANVSNAASHLCDL